MQLPAIEAVRTTIERYRPAFLLAALYDGLLGLAFLFFWEPIFRGLGIEPVADPIYVQLAAGLIRSPAGLRARYHRRYRAVSDGDVIALRTACIPHEKGDYRVHPPRPSVGSLQQ